jgi:hypothetical protein
MRKLIFLLVICGALFVGAQSGCSSNDSSACSCTFTESGITKTTACESAVCIGTVQYYCGPNEDITQDGMCPDTDASTSDIDAACAPQSVECASTAGDN